MSFVGGHFFTDGVRQSNCAAEGHNMDTHWAGYHFRKMKLMIWWSFLRNQEKKRERKLFCSPCADVSVLWEIISMYYECTIGVSFSPEHEPMFHYFWRRVGRVKGWHACAVACHQNQPGDTRSEDKGGGWFFQLVNSPGWDGIFNTKPLTPGTCVCSASLKKNIRITKSLKWPRQIL